MKPASKNRHTKLAALSTSTVTLLRVSSAGSLFFLLVAVTIQAAQFNRPFITPVSNFLEGPYAAWMHAAFFIFAISIALFAVVAHRFRDTRRSLLSALLLYLCTLSLFMMAWTWGGLPMPYHPSWVTRHHMHVVSAIAAFVSALFGIALMTAEFWRYAVLDGARGLLALLVIGCFIGLTLDPILAPINGALEKLVIVQMIAWQLTMTRRLGLLHHLKAQTDLDTT